jgi:pimeloyl-ACP methyl ester carboxylesterase
VVGYARLRATLRLNLEPWAALHARGGEDLGKFLTSLTFSEEYLAALPPAAVQRITERLSGVPTAGTAAQIAFALGIDVHADLKDVHVPTLVIAATGDQFVSPEHSAELAHGIADARLVHVTGGHASIFEDPQQTQEALPGFLQGLTLGRTR